MKRTVRALPPDDLLSALEPAQLAAAASRPYPRRRLGGLTRTLLIGLRLYVLVALPIVAYAFWHALKPPH